MPKPRTGSPRYRTTVYPALGRGEVALVSTPGGERTEASSASCSPEGSTWWPINALRSSPAVTGWSGPTPTTGRSRGAGSTRRTIGRGRRITTLFEGQKGRRGDLLRSQRRHRRGPDASAALRVSPPRLPPVGRREPARAGPGAALQPARWRVAGRAAPDGRPGCRRPGRPGANRHRRPPPPAPPDGADARAGAGGEAQGAGHAPQHGLAVEDAPAGPWTAIDANDTDSALLRRIPAILRRHLEAEGVRRAVISFPDAPLAVPEGPAS
jgi:hypothetical protein